MAFELSVVVVTVACYSGGYKINVLEKPNSFIPVLRNMCSEAVVT